MTHRSSAAEVGGSGQHCKVVAADVANIPFPVALLETDILMRSLVAALLGSDWRSAGRGTGVAAGVDAHIAIAAMQGPVP